MQRRLLLGLTQVIGFFDAHMKYLGILVQRKTGCDKQQQMVFWILFYCAVMKLTCIYIYCMLLYFKEHFKNTAPVIDSVRLLIACSFFKASKPEWLQMKWHNRQMLSICYRMDDGGFTTAPSLLHSLQSIVYDWESDSNYAVYSFLTSARWKNGSDLKQFFTASDLLSLDTALC